MYECTTDQQVIDLVRGGQGVFGIAIGQVWTDVQATLTHLPTETPSDGVGEWPARPALRVVIWRLAQIGDDCPVELGGVSPDEPESEGFLVTRPLDESDAAEAIMEVVRGDGQQENSGLYCP